MITHGPVQVSGHRGECPEPRAAEPLLLLCPAIDSAGQAEPVEELAHEHKTGAVGNEAYRERVRRVEKLRELGERVPPNEAHAPAVSPRCGARVRDGTTKVLPPQYPAGLEVLSYVSWGSTRRETREA